MPKGFDNTRSDRGYAKTHVVSVIKDTSSVASEAPAFTDEAASKIASSVPAGVVAVRGMQEYRGLAVEGQVSWAVTIDSHRGLVIPTTAQVSVEGGEFAPLTLHIRTAHPVQEGAEPPQILLMCLEQERD